jgi:hypothetical protein
MRIQVWTVSFKYKPCFRWSSNQTGSVFSRTLPHTNICAGHNNIHVSLIPKFSFKAYFNHVSIQGKATEINCCLIQHLLHDKLLQQISVCANVQRLKKFGICRKRVKEVNNTWQRKQRIFKGTAEKFLISISTATIRLSTQTKGKDGFKMTQLYSLRVFFQVNCTFFFLYIST